MHPSLRSLWPCAFGRASVHTVVDPSFVRSCDLRARVYMCAHCLSFGLWLEWLNAASASLVYFTVRVRVRTHKRADRHDLTMTCFLQVVPVFWAEIWDKLEQM